MKKIFLFAALLVSLSAFAQHADHQPSKMGYADSVNAGLIKEDNMKGSPVRMAMADVGDAHVHMTYGSPGVKGRNIWGGLVSYDVVWCAGAHNATWVNFSKAVVINGKKIEAGKYGFFVIPKKGKWTVILNSDAEMHLADEYDEKKDVLRMEVEAYDLPALLPRLTFEVIPSKKKTEGEIRFSWEKKGFSIPFKVV